MQTNFFRLDILSPVHIGTGSELDPMSYLMRREDGEMACHVLDTHSWASDYTDPDELCHIFSGGSVPSMRNFLARGIDPVIYGLRRITVSNELILREYEEKLSKQDSANQMLFSPHITSGERVPLIPGSSLKGALRTAVIDWLDQKRNLRLKDARDEDRNGKAYQRRLESALGPITDSAFKQLKISDVTGYADSTLLAQPREVRIKEGKTLTPKSMCEVMPSRLLGKAEQGVLYVKIALGSAHTPSDSRLTLQDGQAWSWSELANIVNSYYWKRFQDEDTKFYVLPNFAKARSFMEQIKTELQCAPDQMILRVGHYSQVEFVTVRNNKPFTRKGRSGKQMPYGTTRTLANGLLPFGWARLTPCNEAEYLEGIACCEASNRAAQVHREERRTQVLAKRSQQLEQIRQQEEMSRNQAEAEQRRQAELAALPEEARRLLLLERGELQESEVVALYNQIDGMGAQIQQRTAIALKDYWQKAGKWNKKDCSKKQAVKVAKIKMILGEV
jgi:CRISPR-associated protein Csm5